MVSCLVIFSLLKHKETLNYGGSNLTLDSENNTKERLVYIIGALNGNGLYRKGEWLRVTRYPVEGC